MFENSIFQFENLRWTRQSLKFGKNCNLSSFLQSSNWSSALNSSLFFAHNYALRQFLIRCVFKRHFTKYHFAPRRYFLAKMRTFFIRAFWLWGWIYLNNDNDNGKYIGEYYEYGENKVPQNPRKIPFEHAAFLSGAFLCSSGVYFRCKLWKLVPSEREEFVARFLTVWKCIESTNPRYSPVEIHAFQKPPSLFVQM